jgi:aspartyl-tRNA synthetase
VLGQLRLRSPERKPDPAGKWELCWLTDFPLFGLNADEKRWDSVNRSGAAREGLHMLESVGRSAGRRRAT